LLSSAHIALQKPQNQGGRIPLSLEQIASVSVAAAAFIRVTFHGLRIEVCAAALQSSKDCRGFARTRARDEARRIAANVAKLPELLAQAGHFHYSANVRSADQVFFPMDSVSIHSRGPRVRLAQ
jgi:hypothetical protein